MNSFSKEVEEIAHKIGLFYLQKNKGDYIQTSEEILKIQIREIEVEGEKVIIKTARPGILIGFHGRNINELSQYLGGTIHIEEVKDINDWIIPSEPCDEYELEKQYLEKQAEFDAIEQMIHSEERYEV